VSHAGLIAYLCRAYAGLTAVPHRYMVDPHDRPFAMRVMGVTWEWSAMPVGARAQRCLSRNLETECV